MHLSLVKKADALMLYQRTHIPMHDPIQVFNNPIYN